MPTPKVIFSVTDRNGAYTTQTVHGKRASSTCSYQAAAEALAAKLHPHAPGVKLHRISSAQGVQVFELEPRS